MKQFWIFDFGFSIGRSGGKKAIYFAFCALLFAISVPVEAQQSKKVPRIGYLANSTASAQAARREAFRQGLRDLGYVEGQNIVIEYRYAEGKSDRLPDLATELVHLKVDVIVAGSTITIQAAKNATKTIPIVMATAGDPVASGFVVSLARPGGNITGLSQMSPELGGKRLELLKEALKKVSVVAVLYDGGASQAVQMKEMEAAARALGMQLRPVKVEGPNDLETAFSVMTRGHASAFIGVTSSMFFSHRGRIADLAVKSRLPAIYPAREFVETGGLMSYGPNISENHRRAAIYVDKILKGAKPADLPVEQPMKFEFIVNLKTAKQIGVTIPPNVLARADRVIR
jgi:putative tryptophan/tyrosine transport system substrate-binding protein